MSRESSCPHCGGSDCNGYSCIRSKGGCNYYCKKASHTDPDCPIRKERIKKKQEEARLLREQEEKHKEQERIAKEKAEKAERERKVKELAEKQVQEQIEREKLEKQQRNSSRGSTSDDPNSFSGYYCQGCQKKLTNLDYKLDNSYCESCANKGVNNITRERERESNYGINSSSNEKEEFNRLTSLLQNSSDCFALEKNYQEVKNSHLYSSDKKTFEFDQKNNKETFDYFYQSCKNLLQRELIIDEEVCKDCQIVSQYSSKERVSSRKCKKCNSSNLCLEKKFLFTLWRNRWLSKNIWTF